ncbi:MAG: hypothetical protein IT444_13275 [Phycisphaeraceae bacterium]|nr:hypothetical protein [Phycisphaeraceae bacterium]
MRHSHRLIAGVLFLSLLALAGCVELVGQRLSLSFDEKTDTLRLLIFYDGIHEKPGNHGDNGAVQIPKFVADGDMMLFDWFGHIKMADIRTVPDPNEPLAEVQTALAASLKTMPIGHYRDARGHIGAAQLVTISNARELIKKLNAAINKSSISFDLPDMPRTTEIWKAAAAKDHQWFTLDGQAVRLAFPVQPGEWRLIKAKGLWELFNGIQLDDQTADGRAKKLEDARKLVSLLATCTISYEEADGMVSIMLGNRSSSNTYRLSIIHDEYEPSLEPVVTHEVPLDLDDAIARFVIHKVDKPAPGVAEIISAGPPEVVPAALLRAATGKDDSIQEAAVEKLSEWARQWNASQGAPAAPEIFDQQKWNDWLLNVDRIPNELMPDPKPPAPPPPPPVPPDSEPEE